MQGDVTTITLHDYDHVMMNPPYHDEARHDVSDDKSKRVANAEKDGDLGRWIESAAGALKPSALLTLIHRADRLPDIMGMLGKHFGRIEIMPILPKADALPKRVILRTNKGGQPLTKQCRNFILHQADGRYTEAAEAVLRHMQPLEFTAI
jgi:tRNA1(Val) A37 N6-methylase TrmN6